MEGLYGVVCGGSRRRKFPRIRRVGPKVYTPRTRHRSSQVTTAVAKWPYRIARTARKQHAAVRKNRIRHGNPCRVVDNECTLRLRFERRQKRRQCRAFGQRDQQMFAVARRCRQDVQIFGRPGVHGLRVRSEQVEIRVGRRVRRPRRRDSASIQSTPACRRSTMHAPSQASPGNCRRRECTRSSPPRVAAVHSNI
jgi:hypothetical protein